MAALEEVQGAAAVVERLSHGCAGVVRRVARATTNVETALRITVVAAAIIELNVPVSQARDVLASSVELRDARALFQVSPVVKLVARLTDLQCFGEGALKPKAGEVQAEWQQVVDVVAVAGNSKSDVKMDSKVEM